MTDTDASKTPSVYVVTCGEYSDYHIEAVFSMREKAREFIAAAKVHGDKWDQGDMDIEEWPINAPPQEWWTTSVTMDRAGKVLRTSKTFGGRFGEKDWYLNKVTSAFPAHYLRRYGIRDGESALEIDVRTDDEQRAIKRANEVRSQMIALGWWDQ